MTWLKRKLFAAWLIFAAEAVFLCGGRVVYYYLTGN